MFYSHQLLARKAPLGQIWMAATMHAKINRKKLDKLDIVKICEEILNPLIPMALRLSGILMGGVVIVYEKKVRLLYDDVTRLLRSMMLGRSKSVPDPTVLPKGKTQAKYEAVTIQDRVEMDMNDIEQSVAFSNSTTATRFQHGDYITMQLDQVDGPYVNLEDEDSSQQHQADAANITLQDAYNSSFGTNAHYQFERFDIEGEEDYLNVTPRVPTTLIPSPADVEMQKASNADDDSKEKSQKRDNQLNGEERNVTPKVEQEVQIQRRVRRRGRNKLPGSVVDANQTIIPGQIYQSWLRDTRNIVTKRGMKRKHLIFFQSMKISKLMEIPPVALIFGISDINGDIQYPEPLMELWRKSSQMPVDHDSPSGRKSVPLPLDLSSPSRPENAIPHNRHDFPVQDFQSEVGPQWYWGDSIEKIRRNYDNSEQPIEFHDGVSKSGGSSRSNTNSFPMHNGSLMDSEILLSGRSKKRQFSSSSRPSVRGLDPVGENDIPFLDTYEDITLERLSENITTPDQELLEETGRTQTPKQKTDPSIDRVTESIRTNLKLHFDACGAPETESLKQLTFGMSKKKAAQLFYHTCVLATHDFLRVQQTVAYGDIIISRGPRL